MSANDLPSIQNAMAEMTRYDAAQGSLIIAMIQNAVFPFFDQRNFEDKGSLEAHLTTSLGELAS